MLTLIFHVAKYHVAQFLMHVFLVLGQCILFLTVTIIIIHLVLLLLWVSESVLLHAYNRQKFILNS